MLRAKRTIKSPYARPGRAPAATKKAKASRPPSTVTQPNQVTTATSTVTQPNQVTPDAIPPALSNQPTTSSGIDIPDPLEFEASPTMLSTVAKVQEAGPHADYYPCQVPLEFWNHLSRK
ncbi:uncharacterized protein LOC134244294 isoform X1 [Saccostrea cucullata]|uniref:uncharacterized protein LOC134244294 isoform X1 n=1 Tax=Saccostrea cuccullata TaxID=36930 RepID=UPI002ED665CD